MNPKFVELFGKRLKNLSVSDYHGLISPGLTCYLNSVLQVLFMTADFRSSIKRCSSKQSTTTDTLLRHLFKDLEKSLAETHSIAQELGITDVYEQRDAAEYFEKILCLTSPQVSKIFKGELNHQTTCATCKKRNDGRHFFWILPLAMGKSSDQTYSVERGLRAFFKNEKVCGENKIYCSQCHQKQEADIACEMTLKPDILTLLLKRFTFDDESRCFVKLRCKVEVAQTLHIENCRYELYALVHHFGSLTGGHYTAEIKSFENDEWYCFNDDTVEIVIQTLFWSGNTTVRSRTAYLLMYRKESTTLEKSAVYQEDQCPQLGVEVDGRTTEAERGDTVAPHRALRDGRCDGGKNWNCLNSDSLKKIYRDSYEEMNNVEPSWPSETSHFSTPPNNGGQRHLETNSEHNAKHSVDRLSGQNHISQKKRLEAEDAWHWVEQEYSVMNGPKLKHGTDATSAKQNGVFAADVNRQVKTMKPRTRANVGFNMADSVFRSCSGCSNSSGAASASYQRRHSPSECRANEPTDCCFSHSNLKRSNEAKDRRLEATRKSSRETKTKNTKIANRKPWK